MKELNFTASKINYAQYALIILLLISCTVSLPVNLLAAPTLNFSDIESGPKDGNTDGAGGLTSSQHGAIVTVWGNYSGALVKAYLKDSTGTSTEVAHYYYEKKADGKLPSGPSDLYTYQRMRELAFSIPAAAADGAGEISLVVDGVVSNNVLYFTVRPGNIYFVKPGGNDTSGTGSWTSAWATIGSVVSGNGKLKAGDIVYTVGVGSASDINVGAAAGLVGTSTNPYALLVYPNTTANVSGTNSSCFRNYNTTSKFWIFSKFTATTTYQAFSLFEKSRIVGNKVTGPNIPSGYSGWIGGNCTASTENPTGDPGNCGGHKIYGNEIYNYGKADGTTPTFHHLYYISNRSGNVAQAYEIAWNYHHDNPILSGIHVYDQSPCGGWSGAIKIHHNVVKNQGGNSININLNCSEPLTAEIYDNIIITDSDYNAPGVGSPKAAFLVANAAQGDIKIYNNTVYGYAESSQFTSSGVDYRNNIMVDTRNIAYFALSVLSSQSNNLFFSSINASLAIPPWASAALKVDPRFNNPATGDFSLKPDSPVRYSGVDAVMTAAPTDFLGKLRKAGAVGIGAIGYDASPKNLKATVTTP